MSKSNKKQIAKNTLSLFSRMLVTMVVSLYTSRVILDALGASDYGLYSVVGGVVVLFSFVSTSMATSTQRFLNFEKGKGDVQRLKRVFGTSIFVHYILAIGLVIIIELAGLWMLNNKLNINPDRLLAANWIFHLSVISFGFTIVNVPYKSAIIANEKMSVFALIGIIEVILKLIIAISISFTKGDKLIWYGALILGATLVINSAYTIYSKRNFPECRTGVVRDKEFLGAILGFSSWNLMSSLSIVLRNQGVSILFNIFFGTIVNAAQGIANQVSNIITGFTATFTQAINPQIVKDYAAGRLESMRSMVMFGSRVSFMLLFLIAFPIFIEADFILSTWLKTVPEYTIIFTRLVLIQVLVESFASVHSTAQGATGDVKVYHFVLSCLGMLNLPISYFILKAGVLPYYVFIILISISAIISVLRLVFLRKSIGLSLKQYLADVGLRCFMVFIVAVPIPVFLKFNLENTLVNAFLVSSVSVVLIILCSFFLGLTHSERSKIVIQVKDKLNINSN